MPSPGILRRFRDLFGVLPRPPSPYSVVCPRGHTFQGQRPSRYQVIPCPQCGEPVFILPSSPFQPREPIGPVFVQRRPFRLAWLMPVFAAAVTLSILVPLFLVLLPRLARPGSGEGSEKLLSLIASGKQALARGDFQRATEELGTALQQARANPAWLTPADLRELRLGERQADLLARLPGQSLQEILDLARTTNSEDEWKRRFAKDYEDKTVLFDVFARLDARGRPEVTLKTIQSGEIEARLALETIRLLEQLDLNQPQRVVFGARLASFDREPGGRWSVGFKPDSGILVTDREAFSACAPTLVGQDPAILNVLDRQKAWVDQNALAILGGEPGAPR